MTLHRLHLPSICAVLSFACAQFLYGCDKQAPAEYSGEPLLSVHGRVELALDRDDEAALIPALAFSNHETGELRIVDVEAEGEFPAEFALDVYLPPPDESFVAVSEYLDEPEAAIGFITAVTPDHPETIRFAGGVSSGGSGGAGSGGGSDRETRWCTPDEEECYVETTSCPSFDSPPEECEVTAAGDPALKSDMWAHFAGLSQNYAVIYLSEAVPADSYTAYMVHSDGALEAGYYLLEIAPDPNADDEGGCGSRAANLAAERYNAQHETSYSGSDVQGRECGGSECDAATLQAFGEQYDRAQAELDCPNDLRVSVVADPERESIAIEIGTNLSPFGS